MATRLLCIDDEPDVATWVEASLARVQGDWLIDSAASLADGAAAYAAQLPDAVLLDIGLPDVGEDRLDGLREVLSWRPVPAVVVLTGHEERVLGMQAVDVGAQDYLDKRTVTPALLNRTIDYARRRHAASLRSVQRADVADERAEALAVYAESVSHDLRAPIGVLMMLAQTTERTIKEGKQDPAAALEVIERMSSSMTNLAARALRFCDELLADAQRSSSQREPVDLMGIVSDAAQLALADEPSGLSVNIDEMPDGLWGQAASLRQALVNLMLNAARHTPRPGGRILVHATVDDDRCTIVVEDNGVGIPPDQRMAVFSAGSSGAGSTGLGLATVERVVTRHGGRVWIEDGRLLGGAAFVMELPWRRPRDGQLPSSHHRPLG